MHRITIELTDAQFNTVSHLEDPFFKSGPNGVVYAFQVIDDNQVLLYTIDPDGTYIVEILNGFNAGWTQQDMDGNELN